MPSNKKRLWLALAVFLPVTGLIIVSVYGLFYADDPKKIPTVFIQKKAPEFTLPDLNGVPVKLSHYANRPVILNFWASWCIPCIKEAKYLEKISNKYQDRGAVVLGIAVNDKLENLLRFQNEQQVTFKSLQDTESGDIMLEYGVTGIPETFFINPDGIIEQKIYGLVSFNDMENFIQKYIRK